MTEHTPAARWHRRGHSIVAYADKQWRWEETGRWVKYGSGPSDPACVLCGRCPTAEGFDPCIGLVRDAISVCCGHGVTEGHVTYGPHEMIKLPRLTAPHSTYPYLIPGRTNRYAEAT